jgi:hypothetical protein
MRRIAFALLLALNAQAALACNAPARFYALQELIEAAYKAKDAATTSRLANEYLELAAAVPCNWNYGNAVHDANRFLGFVALDAGDVDAAAGFLLKAGKSRGSPQLSTFGPELDLADELLQRGRIDAVKAYLTDVNKFWDMDRRQVKDWLAEIERGEKPRLNRFAAAMRPGIAEFVLLGGALAWPVLVAAGSTYWLRARLARKWIFGFVTLVCGYLMLWLAMGALPYVLLAISSFTPAHSLLVVVCVLGALAFALPVLAALAVSRFFVRAHAKT